MDDTTPTNDTTPQENWEQRYAGLQKVVAKRDTDLNTANAAMDALKAEYEAATEELNAFRQRDVDTSEEEAARAQYQALRERFDPRAQPIRNNQARGLVEPTEAASEGLARGWPT